MVLSRTLGAALGTALIGALGYGLMADVNVPQLLRHEVVGIAPGTAKIVRAFHAAFFATALVAAIGAFNASRVPRVRV